VKRQWKRWVVAAVVCLIAGWAIYSLSNAGGVKRRLAALKAQGVPTTTAELNTWYAAVPADQNAGVLAIAAADTFQIPPGAQTAADLQNRPKRGQPTPPEMAEADKAYLAANAAPLEAMHKALSFSKTRYPMDFTKPPFGTITHVTPIKQAASKLAVCAGMAAGCGRTALAAQCIEDGLRMGRTLEAEPMLISLLVEIACEAVAVGATERALTLVPFEDADLERLQAAFLEAATNLSAERACVGELCWGVELLSRPASEIAASLSTSALPGSAATGDLNFEVAGLRLYCTSGLRSRDLAYAVDVWDRDRLISRLQPREQWMEAQALERRLNSDLSRRWLPLARQLLPITGNIFGKVRRLRTVLDCAATSCAIERWRNAHGGETPASLNDLAPRYLKAIPIDPADGRPLRYLRRDKGYVVYGLGENGVDDHGAESRMGATNTDDTFTVER
jgi:hypothetical protein